MSAQVNGCALLLFRIHEQGHLYIRNVEHSRTFRIYAHSRLRGLVHSGRFFLGFLNSGTALLTGGRERKRKRERIVKQQSTATHDMLPVGQVI